jgi:hypothetical protein
LLVVEVVVLPLMAVLVEAVLVDLELQQVLL